MLRPLNHDRSSVLVPLAAALLGLVLVGCKKAEKKAEIVAPVHVSPAIKDSIRLIVNADAVLFPRDQANIVPKISAPVQRFLVNRGDHVKQGQLLAELESRDLTAAAQESQAQYEQAQSNFRSTTSAGVPEQMTKAQTDVDAARQAMDAAKKLLDNRQQLFQDGALARKLVDEARGRLRAGARRAPTPRRSTCRRCRASAARNRSRPRRRRSRRRKGHCESAQAQVSYAEIRSPISGVDRRSAALCRRDGHGRHAAAHRDGHVEGGRARQRAAEPGENVKVGNEATITQADGGELVAGKVTIVSPASDPNSTTVQVWVQADNPGERLHAGQAVHVVIVAEIIKARRWFRRRRSCPAPRARPSSWSSTTRTSRTRRWCRSACARRRWCRSSPASSPASAWSRGRPRPRGQGQGARCMKPGEKAAGEKDEDGRGQELRRRRTGPPARQAHHLRHPHAGRRRRLSRAHDSGRGLSRSRLSRASSSASTTASCPSTRCW